MSYLFVISLLVSFHLDPKYKSNFVLVIDLYGLKSLVLPKPVTLLKLRILAVVFPGQSTCGVDNQGFWEEEDRII